MKKPFFHLVIILSAAMFAAQVITACERKSATEQAEGDQKSDSTQQDAMEMDSTKMAYACPMHPEITGKKGDKCSKCEMMLVKAEKGEADEHKH